MRSARSLRSLCVLTMALCAFWTYPVFAEEPLRIVSEDVSCLPIEDNGVGWARVDNNIPDTTVRLNFRRLNDVVEDMYYVKMHPAGEGRYWGVFPKTEDRILDRHDLEERRDDRQEEYEWALWWREKQDSDHRDPNDELDEDLIRERASLGKQVSRDWLAAMDNETFQAWLEQLENEPAEFYTSVHDAKGRMIAKSKTKVIEVLESCRPDLTPQQLGEAQNLTVGESAHWQRGEDVFHWLCDGIVSRINPNMVKRSDEHCRACIIAWWRKPSVLIPTAATAVIGGGILAFETPELTAASPSLP